MNDHNDRNRGALFKNQRKATDNHPDYTGTINVGGTEYWLSSWIKDGPSGKYMTLSVRPKDPALSEKESRRSF